MSRRRGQSTAHAAPGAAELELRLSEFSIDDERCYVVISYPAIPDAVLSLLSASERAVAVEVLAGRSNAAIARLRHVSPNTIANQVASVFRKLGVGSRGELAARCAGAGRGNGAGSRT